MLAYIWLVCVPEVRGFVVDEEVVKVLAQEGVRAAVQQAGALIPDHLPRGQVQPVADWSTLIGLDILCWALIGPDT